MKRDLGRLVPSGVAFLFVIGLLIAARLLESLPFPAPACGFRKIVGFPCLGCGGTRSMTALAHGNFTGALFFNPAVFIGVVVILVWFGISFYRFWTGKKSRPRAERSRRFWRWFLPIGLPLILLLNWIYLAVYLPEN